MTDEEMAEESWWNDDCCSGAMTTEKIYECGFLDYSEKKGEGYCHKNNSNKWVLEIEENKKKNSGCGVAAP